MAAGGARENMIESAEQFAELANSDDPLVRRKATGYTVPEQVLLDVIDRYPELRIVVARNKLVSKAILQVLAGDPDEVVRSEVAGRINASSDTLAMLAGDPMPAVRNKVAQNPVAPRELLEVLALDRDPTVAAAAAQTIERVYEMLWLQMEVRVKTQGPSLPVSHSAPSTLIDPVCQRPRVA